MADGSRRRRASRSSYRSLLVWPYAVICDQRFGATEFSALVEGVMTALRGAAARIARLKRTLSGLDLTALGSLDRLRILTTDHLQRLHVTTGSPATRSHRTRVLLRRLADRGLVVRLPREVGGRRAGSGQGTFCLTRLGLAVLASPERAPRRRMLWQTRPYFQDHMLAVAELYVGLVEACRAKKADLLGFGAEPACWRRFTGSGGESSVLKPDAAVNVGVGNYELASFVEVDLGTESLPTITRKCRTYVAYWRSGLEQQRRSLFPRVVWLAQDDRRVDGISSMVRRLTSVAPDLFTVALASDGPRVLTTLPAIQATGAAA